MSEVGQTTPETASRSRGLLICVYIAVLGLTLALTWAGHRSDLWDPSQLTALATFAVLGDLFSVETGSARVKLSGSFVGLMLSATLLGGGPAAMVGGLTIAIGWLRWREAPAYLINNLITFVCFPMLTGRGLHLVVALSRADPRSIGYYLIVFAAYFFALALNFLGVAGFQCYRDGRRLREKVDEALVPVFSSHLFSALLTVVAVYAARTLGAAGIGAAGIAVVIFHYLITELLISKRRSEELKRLATTDDLTGLPNREAFRERLAEEVAGCRRTGGGFAVILMDLDHFKEINDTLGHHYGDLVLQDIGPRLARCVGETGIVARLGGDEFAMLSGDHDVEVDAIAELTERLLECVRAPVSVEGLTLELGASIGVARFPHDGDDESTLMRRADIAMYTAKDTQRGSSLLYNAKHDQSSVQRLRVTGDMRRAIGAGEVVLHFQPIVDLAEKRTRSAEGLVRWQHPELGLLGPGAFISTIERTGLIGPLTRHVLARAVEQCATWQAAGDALSVAVNLSVRDLLDQDLPRDIELTLERWELKPSLLQLEITESMLMSDPERALDTVKRINDLGVRFAVDDFGTGYSSLAYLRRLPVDKLKIDRSFVSSMLTDPSALIIVRSTINLAHDLGLRIVAEGVEDEATAACLEQLGCDLAQGYLYARPLTPDAFEDRLRAGHVAVR